ncbi:MAG: hypothetical protein KC933_10640 [Myxococcales bacterium]|nr:hypothetical protein [Myxococcales bacterium]
MHARSLTALCLAFGLVAACGGGTPSNQNNNNDNNNTVPDSGVEAADAGFVDTGVDAGVEVDSGVETDSGVPEADAGIPLEQELVPGSHVQVKEGRISVMQDTFDEVKALLGPGTRTAVANTRSYEWSLADGVTLTVWFANSNLDDDDAPPNDVDATDVVLWVAVQGGFTATTPAGVGLGATRAAVETAYGAAPNETSLTNPPGTLLQYYKEGLMVALDAAGMARTITVHRVYGQNPDGQIDVANGRIRFQAGNIEGQDGLNRGTSQSSLTNLLGMPDAQGNLRVQGQTLITWSYGFIGLEFFFLDNRDTVLFMSVHAPYYGVTTGQTGVGSTRAEMEAFLSGAGYDGGSASSNARFICYGGPMDVGVSYSADTPPVVTSITTPLLACP